MLLCYEIYLFIAKIPYNFDNINSVENLPNLSPKIGNITYLFITRTKPLNPLDSQIIQL